MVYGLDGMTMLLGLAVGILLLIFLVLKTKVQAFLALILATIFVGLVGGMPLATITLENGTKFGILHSITTGFGGTLANIGIIIGFGVMMGQIFEISGAAKRMAYTFLKMFGQKREEEALAITGFLVSIPIFCDSGFIVLAPIAKAISKAVKKSVIALGVSLAAGLVITHSMVPPTPGPLGVVGIFGVDVGQFLIYSILLAIPMTAACIIYARFYLAKKYCHIVDENGEIVEMPHQKPDYTKALSMSEEDMPGTLVSFLPLLVPIILILINTIANAFGYNKGYMEMVIFLGQPIVAVGIGLVLAIGTLARKFERKKVLEEMEKGMAAAGIVMLVTGGGGALGQIIKDSGLGSFMAAELSQTAIPIILLPLVVSTAMRFIQGSGTVAMLTAASITAPIIIAAGANPVLGALACCVGSTFFGYFNDSYFWVVNRTLGISEAKDQLKIWSITSTIAWVTGSVIVVGLSFFM